MKAGGDSEGIWGLIESGLQYVSYRVGLLRVSLFP